MFFDLFLNAPFLCSLYSYGCFCLTSIITPAIIALHISCQELCKSPVSLLGRTACLCPRASALYLTLLLEEQIPEAAAQTHRNAKCQSAGSPWPYWMPRRKRGGRRWDMREGVSDRYTGFALNLNSLDGAGGYATLACQARCVSFSYCGRPSSQNRCSFTPTLFDWINYKCERFDSWLEIVMLRLIKRL